MDGCVGGLAVLHQV